MSHGLRSRSPVIFTFCLCLGQRCGLSRKPHVRLILSEKPEISRFFKLGLEWNLGYFSANHMPVIFSWNLLAFVLKKRGAAFPPPFFFIYLFSKLYIVNVIHEQKVIWWPLSACLKLLGCKDYPYGVLLWSITLAAR